MWSDKIGIVIEVFSGIRCLGKTHPAHKKKIWIDEWGGHVTKCITLPSGRFEDDIVGIRFQVHTNRGDNEDDNLFFYPWWRIAEVRDLQGKVLLRNWHLCPRCRVLGRFRGKEFIRPEFLCPGCGRIVPKRTPEE